jgi:hypothetical protein
MNIAIGKTNSGWNGLKARYVIGFGGIALAFAIALAGFNAWPGTDSKASPASPVTSQPMTLFQTSADAAFAAAGPVEVPPTYATMADAYDALPLVPSDALTSNVAAAPLYANMADAAEATLAGFVVEQPQVEPAISIDAYPLVQEMSHPQFSGVAPSQSEAPLFGTMADADYASH